MMEFPSAIVCGRLRLSGLFFVPFVFFVVKSFFFVLRDSVVNIFVCACPPSRAAQARRAGGSTVNLLFLLDSEF